jgi:hypothetical protein
VGFAELAEPDPQPPAIQRRRRMAVSGGASPSIKRGIVRRDVLAEADVALDSDEVQFVA